MRLQTGIAVRPSWREAHLLPRAVMYTNLRHQLTIPNGNLARCTTAFFILTPTITRTRVISPYLRGRAHYRFLRRTTSWITTSLIFETAILSVHISSILNHLDFLNDSGTRSAHGGQRSNRAARCSSGAQKEHTACTCYEQFALNSHTHFGAS